MSAIYKLIRDFFPPKPHFTEKNLSDLCGKVYIVTGASSGVGQELARILYSKNAKVYVATRSEEKAAHAIDIIKQSTPNSKGILAFLNLDLANLATIKRSAEEFLSKESRLHALFNNAGVMIPPQGVLTPQRLEMHIGVNNVGPFMFTKLLMPIMVATAQKEPPDTVRIVWVSSAGAPLASPKPGGVPMDKLDDFDTHNEYKPMIKYSISKAGNYLHATEFAKRYRSDGIISVAVHPGNLHSELYRRHPSWLQWFITHTITYPCIFGAYTEMFAGLSPDVTMAKSGGWIQPWGRFENMREDLVVASKNKAEGGTGHAEEFWYWSEKQIRPFL